MGYRTKLVKIGNSQGVRIPKTILEQAGMEEDGDVEVVVSEERLLVIQPVNKPRRGWEEAFAEMAAAGDDDLLDEPIPTRFDEQEWDW